MKKLILISLFFCCKPVISQTVIDIDAITSHIDTSKSIYVRALSSDTNSSSFYIQITDKVKKHYHQFHTETLVVLSGKARMQLGDSSFVIKAHDHVIIPPETEHQVEVLSSEPLKVISIQAPEFLGKDRIWIND